MYKWYLVLYKYLWRACLYMKFYTQCTVASLTLPLHSSGYWYPSRIFSSETLWHSRAGKLYIMEAGTCSVVLRFKTMRLGLTFKHHYDALCIAPALQEATVAHLFVLQLALTRVKDWNFLLRLYKPKWQYIHLFHSEFLQLSIEKIS